MAFLQSREYIGTYILFLWRTLTDTKFSNVTVGLKTPPLSPTALKTQFSSDSINLAHQAFRELALAAFPPPRPPIRTGAASGLPVCASVHPGGPGDLTAPHAARQSPAPLWTESSSRTWAEPNISESLTLDTVPGPWYSSVCMCVCV